MVPDLQALRCLYALEDETVMSGRGCWCMRLPAVRRAVRREVVRILTGNFFNRTHTAEALGIHRNSLLRIMRELEIPLGRGGAK